MTTLNGYEVEVVSDAEAVWTLLNTDGLDRAPFQSQSWLSAWFSTYHAGKIDCHLGVVRRVGDPRPLLLLPLVVERRHGVRVLTLPDRGVSDYQAALVSPDYAADAAVADQILDALIRLMPPADILHIERMPPASVDRVALRHRTRLSKFSSHPLPIDADFEAVRTRRFDPSTARRLTRNRRKLENKGTLEFDFVNGPAALADLDRLLDWRSDRFRAANKPGQDAVQRQFYHRLIADNGIGRVGRLRLNGDMIGGCLAIVYGQSILLLAVANDPRFKNWAPGLITFESCLAKAIAEGIQIFDLTIGDASYKAVFGVDTLQLLEIRQALTWRGRLTLAALDTRLAVGRLLRQWGILDRLRRRKTTAAAAGTEERDAPLPDAAKQ